MPSQSEIQAEITTRILDGLQKGVVPWRKPWRNDPNSAHRPTSSPHALQRHQPAIARFGVDVQRLHKPLVGHLAAVAIFGCAGQEASMHKNLCQSPLLCKPTDEPATAVQVDGDPVAPPRRPAVQLHRGVIVQVVAYVRCLISALRDSQTFAALEQPLP